MAGKKDIIEDAGMRKMPCSVPEGYFENLQARLSTIPSEHPITLDVRPALWGRIRPYVALAAAFIFMVVAGTGILKLSTKGLNAQDDIDELYSYAGYVLMTDPYAFYDEDESSSPTEDDIAEYLLNTGVPIEHIYYYGNE